MLFRSVRSDNGPEFTAKAVREWLQRVGAETLFIEPGSPWENGYVESFNGKLRDECLNEETYWTRAEAQVLVDWWRDVYNQERPHRSLGMKTPEEVSKDSERGRGGIVYIVSLR